MSREEFKSYKPQPAILAIIEQANAIIEEYKAQRFKLILRQLYYQFVARNLLENLDRQYRRLSRIISAARDGGLIDWDAIEDRTREVHTHVSWESPAHRIRSVSGFYREDLWFGQKYRPEVWIEKEALVGVIEDVCRRYRVPYFAHRGDGSTTVLYEAGKRFARYRSRGLVPLVLHLVDHDPKGIRMTRNVRERLKMYAGHAIEVRRIALNIDQARRYRLPPNSAKETDSNYAAYVREFGTRECWELDALSPAVIADLIETEVKNLINQKAWRAALLKEQRGRYLMDGVAANWTKVEKMLEKLLKDKPDA